MSQRRWLIHLQGSVLLLEFEATPDGPKLLSITHIYVQTCTAADAACPAALIDGLEWTTTSFGQLNGDPWTISPDSKTIRFTVERSENCDGSNGNPQVCGAACLCPGVPTTGLGAPLLHAQKC